jgi:hypothetical protein
MDCPVRVADGVHGILLIFVMKASDFWKAVLVDQADFLERFLKTLRESRVRYCLIGGQAVNAYVEPLVTLDLDIVVAAEEIESLIAALYREFIVEHFPHTINVSAPKSKLRVQIQTDHRYLPFLDQAEKRNVLDYELPVGSRTCSRARYGLPLMRSARRAKN